jgi:hypothetical protein
MALIATVGLGIAIPASQLASTARWLPVLEDSETAIFWSIACAGLIFLLALREIKLGRPDLLAKLLPLTYFALVLLGFAMLHVLRVLRADAWPIAGTQRLPSLSLADHALVIALVCGCLLTVAVRAGLMWGARRARPVSRGPSWEEVALWAPALAATGVFGALVVVAKTGSIPLFANNIDELRYQQGSGVGFATLLEYEFLTSACVAGAAWEPLRGRRGFLGLVFVASTLGLIVFRVERFPLIFIVTTLLFLAAVRGRRVSRHTLAAVVLGAIACVFALGVFRLSSQQTPVDGREAVVRAIFDVSPEFREQAFAFQIYPHGMPHTGRAEVAAVAASVVPSGMLRVAGIDKGAAYTDSSRQYSLAMRQLGYYSSVKPIRIGLIGELWAAFGPSGLVLVLLLFGVIVGRIAASRDETPLGQLRRALASSLCLLALITPLATILPIALMVVGPIFVLQKLLAR